MPFPEVSLNLADPPRVHGQGRATHGVVRLVDEFRLPDLWSLHLYSYSAELEVDATSYAIIPGSVSLVPPGSSIRYRYEGPSTHLYAHLRAAPAPPAEQTAWPLQLIMYPGPDLPQIAELMQSAVGSAPTRPERTRADVWMALLRLAALGRNRAALVRHTPTEEHLTKATAYIEGHLSERLTVPGIAAAVGLSQGHLTRLFTARLGSTVVSYLRRRRIEHARRLLEQSTMSVAAIAAAVGIPDLQAFNKACRTVSGHGPRALRELAASASV